MRAEKRRGAPGLGKSELSAAGRSLTGQTAAQKARRRDRRARKQGHDTGKRAAGRRQARKPENIHRAGGAGKPRQLPRSKKGSEHRGIKRRRARRSARGASPLLALPGIICRASSAGHHLPDGRPRRISPVLTPKPRPPLSRQSPGGAQGRRLPLCALSLSRPPPPHPAPHRPRAPAARSRRRGLFFCCGTPSPSRSFFFCTPFFLRAPPSAAGQTAPPSAVRAPSPAQRAGPFFHPCPLAKRSLRRPLALQKLRPPRPGAKSLLKSPFSPTELSGVFCFAAQKKEGPGAHGAHRGPPSRRLVCLPPFFKGGSDRAGDLAPRSPSDCRKGP